MHVRSGERTYPIHQIRTSLHGLARWMGVDPALRLRMGYALAFPHSDFKGKATSPSLVDTTVSNSSSIMLDQASLPRLGERVVEIMRYWKEALRNQPLGRTRKKAIVDAICPALDGTPTWARRVFWDERLWLRLTDDQADVVDLVVSGKNMVITGWPGTGKTLVLIEAARRFVADGKRVLFLTFNSLLCGYIEQQLNAVRGTKVVTWHSFCRGYSKKPGQEFDNAWFQTGCLEGIRSAMEAGKLPEFDVLIVDEAQAFKVEWVEWLCSWHGARQVLMSCDETQVFDFEEGRVQIDDLCKLIETRRPYLLTHAIRSPRAVLERLKAVMRPAFQLVSPRELDGDAIDERLSVHASDDLNGILSELLDSGVQPSDIVVLAKYGWMKPVANGIRYSTVPKFRGMEAPVVVICGAEAMDDTELFCAYSRATTLCIATYDAHKLALDGPAGEFQRIVLDKPGYAQSAERARLDAYPTELIRTALNAEWFGLETVNLGWSDEWKCWLVEEANPLSRYWIDYLVTHYPWSVCSWGARALYRVSLAPAIQSVVADGGHITEHELSFCTDCSLLTPHRLDAGSTRVCIRCRGEIHVAQGSPTHECLSGLKAIDSLVAAALKPISAGQRTLIPLSLAAGHAVEKSLRASQEQCRGLYLLGGRVSYHAAMGFMLSLVNLSAPGKQIVIRDFADRMYQRYRVPDGLSQGQWRKEVAQAASVLFSAGMLSKVRKGVYEVLPPSGSTQ